MGEDGGAHVSLWTGHAALKQCLLQNETARHREQRLGTMSLRLHAAHSRSAVAEPSSSTPM